MFKTLLEYLDRMYEEGKAGDRMCGLKFATISTGLFFTLMTFVVAVIILVVVLALELAGTWGLLILLVLGLVFCVSLYLVFYDD